MPRASIPALIASLAFLLAPPVAAQDLKAIEQRLKADYEKQIIILREARNGKELRFDPEGRLRAGGDRASWTLSGVILINELDLGRDDVTLKGTRLWVGCERGVGFVRYKSNQEVKIDVQLPPAETLEDSVGATLERVAVPEHRLSEVVPLHWRRMVQEEPKDCRIETRWPASASRPTDQESPESASSTAHLRMNTNTAEARLVHRVIPRYPQAPRKYLKQGSVTLCAVIGTDGRVRDIEVVQAAGFGFDDAAVEAIRQWQYDPTKLDGKPIEVFTEINIVFKVN